MPQILYNPSSAMILRDAGIDVLGHAFDADGNGRERFVLLLDSPAGRVRLTDTPTGALHITVNDTPVGGSDEFAESLGQDDPEFASAIDALLTAAVTRLRRDLADAKNIVANGIVGDLVLDLAGDDDPDA